MPTLTIIFLLYSFLNVGTVTSLSKFSSSESIFFLVKDYLYKKNLKNDIVIVEAGAADGKDTRKMHDYFCKYFRKVSIHAFEPIPDLYQQLILSTSGGR